MREDKELDHLTPEELLVVVMQDTAALAIASGECYRFGWDLQYGNSTNNERMIEKNILLQQSTRIYFHMTRKI